MADMTTDAQLVVDRTASAVVARLLTNWAILAAGKGTSDAPPPAPPRPGKSDTPRPAPPRPGRPATPAPAPARPGRGGAGAPPPAPPRPGGR